METLGLGDVNRHHSWCLIAEILSPKIILGAMESNVCTHLSTTGQFKEIITKAINVECAGLEVE